MNKKIVAVTILVLMSIALAISPIESVFGQNSNLGLGIIQVVPAGSTVNDGTIVSSGSSDELLNLQGTIYTANSTYQIIFNSEIVASGLSNGYYVNTNFSVPEVPAGTYTFWLRDVAIDQDSSQQNFQVQTNETIIAVPAQMQEGSSTVLAVKVTGGVPGTSYVANVSVVLPGPLSTQYNQVISLGTADQNGTASTQVTFPSSSFQPSGSLTDYAGSYTAYFNESSATPAQTTFSVGFLDSITYHRGQTATILAIGYQPNQAATLTVTNPSGTNIGSESVTASADGVISTTYVIPSTAGMGNYNVTITAQGTQKAVVDSELFSISGYAVQIKTVNLANEVVSQIVVQAVDIISNTTVSGTSGDDGIAQVNLEAGNVALTAFWNGVNVGGTNITVTGPGTFNLQCQLTDLKIVVQNQNGVSLPFVNLTITFQYQPVGGSVQIGNVTGETDVSGAYVFNSTLTGISYTIDASMYNHVFNSGNDTFSNIPAQPITTLTITCPNEILSINIVGNNQEAIPDARIELIEVTNSLYYTATADSSGSVTTQVSFGMYSVSFYKNNILINQTIIDVFGPTQTTVQCTLYGIQVSVKVVDFFGSPISNANVTLNGPASERFSAMTKGDGTVVFSNVVGGDMQVVAFAPGAQNNYQAMALIVDQPTSVQLQIGRYVALGSLLIPVSSLIAVIVILVAVVLLAIVEIYRRKTVKRATS